MENLVAVKLLGEFIDILKGGELMKVKQPGEANLNLIPEEVIENKILFIRSVKIMLDIDLAELYGVSTSALNQAVKRNLRRFPADFMFQYKNKLR